MKFKREAKNNSTPKKYFQAPIKHRNSNETIYSIGWIASTRKKKAHRFSLIIVIAYLHVYPKIK